MNMHEPAALRFDFDNSYARRLEGFYTPWQAAPVPKPQLLQFNRALASELGLDADALETDAGAAIFAGNTMPHGAEPLAQAYAGHQFGGFSPQLGDGRALLLGELIDTRGQRRDIQLKGSGRTPFSRGGDGKAAIGPVLREYLMGEAMHALGIPTTRALAAVATGEQIFRETPLPGAILTRVAASHIRVGTFQFFAARGQTEQVQQLADYVIDRHYRELADGDDRYLALFNAVADAQASLVAKWMHVGFIHGVMNTDNMAVSGETIDYGPCAFMDAYAPGTVFSSIDAQGRYAYANQPLIAQWNLTRFAETLLRIVRPDEAEATRVLTEAIEAFPTIYLRYWLVGMKAKIGLEREEEGDLDLVNALLEAMDGQNVDYTQLLRRLSKSALGDDAPARALFDEPAVFDEWAGNWRARLVREAQAPAERAEAMDRINPLYIPRNHKVEEALSAAVHDMDIAAFERLLRFVQNPFAEIDGGNAYELPAPASSTPYRTFCGT